MSRKNNLIYCNCCGREIGKEEKIDEMSFLAIEKEWGYFSEGKDGQIHSMDICEPCYEKIVNSFEIAPEITKVTEYL